MGYETNGMVNYDVNDPRFAAIPANNSWLSGIGNSLSNSWGEFSKMPWKSTPSTYDSNTGIFTQGTPGKYDSMLGFGKDVASLFNAYNSFKLSNLAKKEITANIQAGKDASNAAKLTLANNLERQALLRDANAGKPLNEQAAKDKAYSTMASYKLA